MAIVTRIGWILAGVLIGALLTTSTQARFQLPEPRQARLAQVAGNVVAGRTATLIRDTKSDGCWLLISTSDGVAIAQAPPAACYQ
jgi:hypothetical protein